MPEDYRVGPLDDGRTDAYGAILRACRALVDGRVDREVLDPENADLIEAILRSSLEGSAAIREYRIGRIVHTSADEARAPVRLLFEEGSAEAQVYLVSRSGGWFVSDFQVAPVPRSIQPRGNERFFPSPYPDPHR